MARVYTRYGTRITAQASAAITAGNFSAGSQTLVNTASGQNADGAQWYDVYIDVTSAPSSAASCEVWIAGSSDASDETDYQYALTGSVPAAADQYRVGTLHTSPRQFRAKMKAISYGFTATLYLVPVHFADA